MKMVLSSRLSNLGLMIKKTIWYSKKALIPGVRGVTQLPFFQIGSKPVMIGSGTTILYRRKVHAGWWGFIGANCWINAYSSEGLILGKRVTIREYGFIQLSSSITTPGVGLILGDNVYIGPRCNLGSGGLIRIGTGTLIGSDFTVVAENHLIENGEISKSKVTRIGVTVGDNCWIGHRVLIVDGVNLGDGCIVGAGSVVTKSFPSKSKIAGVPARAI
jgi:acetyltransferase-like isoleucine patch superfamily enzyme